MSNNEKYEFFARKYIPLLNFKKILLYPAGEKFALITGATSGIGKAFAYSLAGLGHNLIITGRKLQVLTEVTDDIKSKYNIEVIKVVADLSVQSDIESLLRIISNKKIDILINNAGYGIKEQFHHDEINNQLKMLKVHVTSPLILIHAVMDIMMKEKCGSIINVSSLAAFFPTSGNAMYASTKSFLKNFTLSLRMEMKQYNIQVQCLCPGFTYTDFHRNAGLDKSSSLQNRIGWMDADKVVKYSLHSLEKGKVICVPGILNKVTFALIHVVPACTLARLSDLVYCRLFKQKNTLHKKSLIESVQLT